jgi:trimeric autotransporter adhesin
MSRITRSFLFLLMIMPLAVFAEWWDGFAPSGIDGTVLCITGHNEDLYAGGLFDQAGGLPAANIARYTGRRWVDIDGGTDGRVLTVFDYGTTVVIGGNFFNAGGTPCNHVADLQLGEWTPMGDGLGDWPNRFLVHDTALHACGKLDTDDDLNYSTIARWDGAAWHDEIEGASWVNEAYDLAHFDGSLFFGGVFEYDAFDPDIHNFTEWDGDTFGDFDFGSGEIVTALQVVDNGIYIGGIFTYPGSVESRGLVYMTSGRNLSPVSQPTVQRMVVDLDVWHDVLVVGQTNVVIPYNGLAWLDTLGGVLDGSLTSLCTIGIDLYAAGSFPGSVARWDPFHDEWVQLGGSPGTTNHEASYMRALCRHDGRLIAAGEFFVPSVLAGESHSNNIGWWDGEAWHRLGGGLNATVYDVVSYDGDLIAAGHFDFADGAPAAHLARWDGTTWLPLGDPDADVNTLAVWDGDLIIGGFFHNVGGEAAERIAAWDGENWRALGNGFNSGVNDLHVHEGALYAGGVFTTSGFTTTNRVARWSGSEWQHVGHGVDNIVYALGSHEGDLYVGGYFTSAGAGATPTSGITRWDGANWHGLGDGVDGPAMTYKVATLASVDGELYVGGDFTEAGGAPAAGLAVWDGANWRQYEGGVQRGTGYAVVHDLQIHEGDLYLGGNFSTIGGRGETSYNLARWVDGTLVPVYLDDFTAGWTGARVDLTWRVIDEEPVAFRLDASSDGETWTVPYTRAPDGAYRAEDTPRRGDRPRDVVYELSCLEDGGTEPIQLGRESVQLPPLERTRIAGAHPNPFNPEVTISFTLVRGGRVDLAVYDPTGRRVATLADRPYAAGEHDVSWEGRDASGRAAASGAYLVRLETETAVDSAKIVLVR